MRDPAPYTVPKQPGGWKALALAIIVHIGLVVMLVIGMHWTIEAPAVVEAEIWDIQVREAAPQPVPEMPPEPEPEPVREPEPEPTPPEPVAPPPPKVETPPAKDPDIVLAEEKKRKEEEARKRRLEEEQKRKLEEEKKLAEEKRRKEEEQKKLAEEKKRKELEEQKKLAEEKKRKEEEEKKRKLAEEQKRKEEEKRKKLAEEKARQEKLAAERRRKEDMERMMAQVGAGGAGTAERSQGGRGDAAYISRLSSRIKSNTRFIPPPDLGGNPAVEYRVDLLPDGSVRGIRKLQSSGVSGFDEAVERAIRLSEPFPADDTGKVAPSFIFLHRPKDN